MEGITQLDQGLHIFYDFIKRMMDQKENEIKHYKELLIEKDDKIKELSAKLTDQEATIQSYSKQLTKAQKKMVKLSQFKQTILESLVSQDEEETSPFPDSLGNQSFKKNLEKLQDKFKVEIADQEESLWSTDSLNLSSSSISYIQGETERERPKPGVVDGRAFFKKARSLLSYDAFTSLLWQVKCYNNKEQSKKATLEQVMIIMSGHSNLCQEFKSLMEYKS